MCGAASDRSVVDNDDGDDRRHSHYFTTAAEKELPHYACGNLVLNAVLIARKGILITTEQK